MRFASLGSGSRGNATLICHERTRLLVDCGFSLAETERRLQRLDMAADSLTAIIVTHEHEDHLRGVARLAQRYKVPVWLTPGTLAAWPRADAIETIELFSPHEAFAIQDLEILPYPVPHDAREPCQLIVSDGAHRFGLLSDAGDATPHMLALLDGCDALLLEANHDPEMLAAGPYPVSVKRRIGGRQGHLSNGQAAALLARIDSGCLQHLVAAHLSEQTNTPALARAALAGALNCSPDWVAVADQQEGLAWRSLTVR